MMSLVAQLSVGQFSSHPPHTVFIVNFFSGFYFFYYITQKKGGGAILQVSRNQYSFLYTGHIYWYILMKCRMVACINILYW